MIITRMFKSNLFKPEGYGWRRSSNMVLDMLESTKEQIKYIDQRNRNKRQYGLVRDIINLDELFKEDIETNKGFILNTSIDYTSLMSDEAKLRELDSIFSAKFGQYTKDTLVFKCECGNLESDKAGEYCSQCGTFTDKKIYQRGWFKLQNGFKVFNPDYFNLLKTNIDVKKVNKSKKALETLIFSSKGDFKYNIFNLMNKEILIEFINSFVLDHMKDFFLSRIDSAMTSSIPVISSNYRYYKVEKTLNEDKPNIRNHSYNQYYIAMSYAINDINSLDKELSSMTSKVFLLSHLTHKWLQLSKEMSKDLGKDKKKSYFRGKTSGRYKSASAKLIIECEKGLEIDEGILPYTVFGLIVNKYYKQDLKDLGLSPEGFKRLETFRPSNGDKIILNKLLKRMKDRKVNIITLLRAPSIYKTSILSLKIVGLENCDVVKINDITLGVCLKGDKDGDTAICVLSKPDIALAEFFAYHPSKGIFNPLTGEINSSFEIQESQYYIVYEAFESKEGRERTKDGRIPTIFYSKDTGIKNPIHELLK